MWSKPQPRQKNLNQDGAVQTGCQRRNVTVTKRDIVRSDKYAKRGRLLEANSSPRLATTWRNQRVHPCYFRDQSFCSEESLCLPLYGEEEKTLREAFDTRMAGTIVIIEY